MIFIKYILFRMSELLMRRGKRPWLYSDFVYRMLPDGKEFKRTLQFLHDVTHEVKIPNSVYRLSPQKITIGFSASIAFKIVNQSEYTLGL